MNIFAYKLKFLTPVHFGAAELGGKLEAINFCYSSDTLFSALCCELAGSEFFSKFVDAVAQGKILLSDLLPYTEEKFYLPKPILLVEGAKKVQRVSLDEVRKQSTQRKKQKKMEYLRAANLKKYLASYRLNAKGFLPRRGAAPLLRQRIFFQRKQRALFNRNV